ncbi:MAG: hypothetical protein H6Q75_1012 [Firmicutes bacterium]|nr:hypothetical protein [Bacillota bacterium]
MEFSNYSNVIGIGFIVWVAMAPRTKRGNFGERFLAYMAALLFSLLGTSGIMMAKPNAFFFTVGGALAFLYVVVRSMVTVRIKR